MSDTKILDAVRQLDVKNDNHWTATGEPRLDTIKMLAGDQGINRDAVSAAAPGFTRSTAEGYVVPGATPAADNAAQGVVPADAPATTAEGAAVPPVPPLPTAPAADGLPTANQPTASEGGAIGGPTAEDSTGKQTGAVGNLPPQIAQGATEKGANMLNSEADDKRDAEATTAPSPNTHPLLGGPLEDDPARVRAAPTSGEGEAQLNPLDHGVEGDSDALQALETELEAASERSNDIRGYVDDANKALAESTANESRLRALIEKARGRTGNSQAIQSYFAQQDKAAADRAGVLQAVREGGIDLKKLGQMTGRAPIDQAVAKANSGK